MRKETRLGRLIPQYSVPWLLGALVWQLSLYFLAKLLTDSRPHYDMSLPIDHQLPLCRFLSWSTGGHTSPGA